MALMVWAGAAISALIFFQAGAIALLRPKGKSIRYLALFNFCAFIHMAATGIIILNQIVPLAESGSFFERSVTIDYISMKVMVIAELWAAVAFLYYVSYLTNAPLKSIRRIMLVITTMLSIAALFNWSFFLSRDFQVFIKGDVNIDTTRFGLLYIIAISISYLWVLYAVGMLITAHRKRNIPLPYITPVIIGAACYILFSVYDLLQLLIIEIPFFLPGTKFIGFIILAFTMMIALGAHIVDIFRNADKTARLNFEVDTAQKIQLQLLPATIPRMAGAAITGRFVPFEKVGGDFYDVIPLSDGRCAIMIADVSGHGIAAAMIASMTHMTLGYMLNHYSEPDVILRELNNQITPKITPNFVTMVFGFFDPKSGTFTYANAGHPPFLYCIPDERVCHRCSTAGMLLGMKTGNNYEKQIISMKPESRLLLYTDGLFERHNKISGEDYGEDRLLQLFQSSCDRPIHRQATLLLDQIWSFGGMSPYDDDVTFLLIEKL